MVCAAERQAGMGRATSSLSMKPSSSFSRKRVLWFLASSVLGSFYDSQAAKYLPLCMVPEAEQM